jgi:hypothetical protein
MKDDNLPAGEAQREPAAPSAGTGRAIQCKYSCFKCGIHRQIVTVRGRTTEDVVEWLNTVCAPALSADHDRRSPDCRITKLDEVMVPLFDDQDKIGAAGDRPAHIDEIEPGTPEAKH